MSVRSKRGGPLRKCSLISPLQAWKWKWQNDFPRSSIYTCEVWVMEINGQTPQSCPQYPNMQVLKKLMFILHRLAKWNWSHTNSSIFEYSHLVNTSPQNKVLNLRVLWPPICSAEVLLKNIKPGHFEAWFIKNNSPNITLPFLKCG